MSRIVGVAIATYCRPEKLGLLLDSLARQELPPEVSVQIAVVDNDATGSARDTVNAARKTVTSILYAQEPKPGIAAARNRGIDLLAHCDKIAFIDDDETADAGWLSALLSAQDTYGAPIITGPVDYMFPSHTPRWMKESGVFVSPSLQTGDHLPYAATNNLLIDNPTLQNSGVRFDNAFGLTGGSDTLLTATLVMLGHEIVWCREARVSEVVETERVSVRWILQRARRTGNTHARVRMILSRKAPPFTSLELMVEGAARVLAGVGQLLAVLLVKPHSVGRPMRTIFRGIGIVSALTGRNVDEYHR